ncbi:MAG: hypothetical protein LBL59_05520 [Xanthomonadaceae bacterium]|nr:hypothetical protein [Xanthomonadaceae bacterium]
MSIQAQSPEALPESPAAMTCHDGLQRIDRIGITRQRIGRHPTATTAVADVPLDKRDVSTIHLRIFFGFPQPAGYFLYE